MEREKWSPIPPKKTRHPGRNEQINKPATLVSAKLTRQQLNDNKIEELFGMLSELEEKVHNNEVGIGLLFDRDTRNGLRFDEIEERMKIWEENHQEEK